MDIFTFCLVCFTLSARIGIEGQRLFPRNFWFGASTSAYQVEGAWNESDKGLSIWDEFTHEQPNKILDGSNADVSADSYHLYGKDIAALKELGVNVYRFSLSWSRLLPFGFLNGTSQCGLDYYNGLINELLINGITPIITLYHGNIPEPLQRIGGFTNGDIVNIFEDYAYYAFLQFGDRVKHWITFNEISTICSAGCKTDKFAPALNLPGKAEYLCVHYMLLSHARVYRMYDQIFRSSQKGEVGLAVSVIGYYPLSDKEQDIDAADLAQDFSSGWILNPILSKTGDYPKRMKDVIKKKSLAENYKRSRLPEFTEEEIGLLKGTTDFIGINHYTTVIFTNETIDESSVALPVDVSAMFPDDLSLNTYRLTEWPVGDLPNLPFVPEGFRAVLKYIKAKYNCPPILITENGYANFANSSVLNDHFRVAYINNYLSTLLTSMAEDDIDIRGYLYWSLIDNFEWIYGYSVRYGLYAVDFNSLTKERIGRLSSRVYKNIIQTRAIDFNYLPEINNDATII